jgi:hypothetical protein
MPGGPSAVTAPFRTGDFWANRFVSGNQDLGPMGAGQIGAAEAGTGQMPAPDPEMIRAILGQVMRGR